MIEAFSKAHLAACLAHNAAPDDPCFDEGYIRDCLTLLDMIERGASAADLAAYDAASNGIFEWKVWFCRTLAQMPSEPAHALALEAFQGMGAVLHRKPENALYGPKIAARGDCDNLPS